MMAASGPNKFRQWQYHRHCNPLDSLQNCGWLSTCPKISSNHSLTWPFTRAEYGALSSGRQAWALLKAASTNLLLSLAMSWCAWASLHENQTAAVRICPNQLFLYGVKACSAPSLQHHKFLTSVRSAIALGKWVCELSQCLQSGAVTVWVPSVQLGVHSIHYIHRCICKLSRWSTQGANIIKHATEGCHAGLLPACMQLKDVKRSFMTPQMGAVRVFNSHRHES